jgi:hypothetical protein
MYKNQQLFFRFSVIALIASAVTACGGGENAVVAGSTANPLNQERVGAQASLVNLPAQPTNAISVHSKARQGVGQTALIASGITLTDENYDSVVVNVDTGNSAELVKIVNGYLEKNKRVILDTNGLDQERKLLSEVVGEVAGLLLEATTVSIQKTGIDSYDVTPIALNVAGNTPLDVLGIQQSK